MNKNNSTWGIIVVKLIFFLCFLEKLKTPQRHFEINRPLVISLAYKDIKKYPIVVRVTVYISKIDGLIAVVQNYLIFTNSIVKVIERIV